MNIKEVIDRLNAIDNKCELCRRLISAEKNMVIDTLGKNEIITCSQCHIIRRAFKEQGLPIN